MPFSLNRRINKIQMLIPDKQTNYNHIYNIIFTAWPKKDFQTEDQVINLVNKKISYTIFHVKKGNNLENLQIEFEKFKCSDCCSKDPILFYFDCWIYKFNELLGFNLLEFNLFDLYKNKVNNTYIIVDNPKEQKLVLTQFIECFSNLLINDMMIENEKLWIKLKKPIPKQWIQNHENHIPNHEKPNIFNCICRFFG